MTSVPDAATMRRLLIHEARVHAMQGRDLRDLDDSILLLDPADAEPFWNRLEAVRWPDDPTAFDQRLAEIRVLFASRARQPHIWLTPPHDRPADLFQRLVANGFEDMGAGFLMVTDDDASARAVVRRGMPPGLTVDRLNGLRGPGAIALAEAIVGVLLEAFGVDAERGPGVAQETVASLGDERFTHYLARLDGVPVAVARRATFDGLTYLSSIGTVERARGRGLGRLVTAMATVDAAADGSEWVHLGVFADNVAAFTLYESLGFVPSGPPGPDMMLVG